MFQVIQLIFKHYEILIEQGLSESTVPNNDSLTYANSSLIYLNCAEVM
jgi:hypothetical protein